MRRGQAWSMDLVIGVLIFMIAIAIIYSLLTSKGGGSDQPLRLESEVVATKLISDSQVKIANENRLDMPALFRLAQQSETDYASLKKELGIKKEFCIYLVDEYGNLTFITNGTRKYTGIGSGSGEINISGTACGRSIP